MVTFSEKDIEYINNTKGLFSLRGIKDTLKIFEEKFSRGDVEKIIVEMKEKGYDIEEILRDDKKDVSVNYFIVFLLVAQKVLNISDDGIKEMGREGGKLSFLLRFASMLLISVDVLYKNANVGWKKYYKNEAGELHGIELDKENKRTVLELRDFVGHPVHCKYIEGYMEQLIFFVTGKKTHCEETGCVFKGDNSHRFLVTWE
jgi:predicted hydrocarbon binding protein